MAQVWLNATKKNAKMPEWNLTDLPLRQRHSYFQHHTEHSNPLDIINWKTENKVIHHIKNSLHTHF